MKLLFEHEISLSPFFQLWDRGDGIGEISLFNKIIGYVHGEQQLEDGYHYDQETESYIVDENHEYQLVSCFPGYMSSSHELLKPFSNTYIDSIEHLSSLVQSIPTILLPPKPKGSIIDIFSGNEKFLLARNFDFDVIVNGVEFSDTIHENFKNFSQYLKNFLTTYPEIDIKFMNHSYMNGNVYFLYQLQNKYFLHLVFTSDNKVIFGSINKSSQMKFIVLLECSEENYKFICDNIIEKLGISLELIKINISIDNSLKEYLPKRRNLFLEDIMNTHVDGFISKLYEKGIFILERDLKTQENKNFLFCINRSKLLSLKDKFSPFGLEIIPLISLFINDFLKNQSKIS